MFRGGGGLGGRGRLAPSPSGILQMHHRRQGCHRSLTVLITPGATGVTVEHLLGMRDGAERKWR